MKMVKNTNKEVKQDLNKITARDIKLSVNRLDKIRSNDAISINPEDNTGKEDPDENVDDNKPKSLKAQTTEQIEKVFRIEIISQRKPKSHQQGKGNRKIRHFSHVIVAMASEEAGERASMAVDNASRNHFVAQVLSIVAICLFANVILVYLGTISTGIGLLILSYAIQCVPPCRRLPCNVICLTLYVFFYTCILSVIVYTTKFAIIGLAIGILIFIIILGILIAIFVPIDFTRWHVVLGGALLALCLVSIVLLLARTAGSAKMKRQLTWLKLFITTLIVVLYVVMFIIQIQMILGGRTVEVSETEYIVASVMVYNMVITMFINLVNILNLCSNLGLCCK